ncbi:hypothetical protein TNCV_4400321 [Trichonephila clavipes]|nr:hypothetical protein TNCV_4400321 [Trichonephila clavipes]
MATVLGTISGGYDCGFQSKVNEALNILQIFHSAANDVEWCVTESVVLWFVMLLRNPSLSCAKSTGHHEPVGRRGGMLIGSDGPSFPLASSDDRCALNLFGFVEHVNRFFWRIILNPSRLLLFLHRNQKPGQKAVDVLHAA